jgi:hypothetical protein
MTSHFTRIVVAKVVTPNFKGKNSKLEGGFKGNKKRKCEKVPLKGK